MHELGNGPLAPEGTDFDVLQRVASENLFDLITFMAIPCQVSYKEFIFAKNRRIN